MEITEKIIEIIRSNITSMSPEFNDIDADLSQMGMDSIVFIIIIVALEEAFEIEFPDESLLISITNSIRKMAEIVFKEIEKT